MGLYEASGLAYILVGIFVALYVLREFDWDWRGRNWEPALVLGVLWPVALFLLLKELRDRNRRGK